MVHYGCKRVFGVDMKEDENSFLLLSAHLGLRSPELPEHLYTQICSQAEICKTLNINREDFFGTCQWPLICTTVSAKSPLLHLF